VDPSAAPPQIVALAEERASARARHDWATADSLKARIEAAGWRVTDAGTAFDLEPSRPADVIEEGAVYHGSLDSVPSHLDQPASRPASVVVISNAGPDPGPVLTALADHSPPGTQVLVVAERGAVVDGPADEVIRTVGLFSPGDAISAAIRRAAGSIIVVLDPQLLPVADIVSPLRAALEDASVAVAGSGGLWSLDLHRYRPAEIGDVTTMGSGCYAFRRTDGIARGPLDARLQLPASVAAWWGLRLRDEGPDAQPRRAIAIDLPLRPRGGAVQPTEAEARRARRDAYRISDQFRRCRWLAAELPPQGRLVGDGADGDHDHDAADEGRHTDPA
jgi:hypothetical protein